MKTRAFWVIIPAVILTLGACSEKKEPAAKPGDSTTKSEASPGASAPATPTVPATAGTGAASATPVATSTVPAVVKELSAEERASKFGFVRFLPQDTESVVTVYNGKNMAERAMGMKLWKVIEEQVGKSPMMGRGRDFAPPDQDDMPGGKKPAAEDFAIPEGGAEMKAPTSQGAASKDAKPIAKSRASDVTLIAVATEPADEAAAPPAAAATEGAVADAVAAMDDKAGEEGMAPFAPGDMLGLEVTLAVGKSAGEQVANLSTLSNRLSYFQMRGIAKAFVAAAKAGDYSDLKESMGNTLGEELVKNLINDPESGIGLLDRMQMPPVYLAFRANKGKLDAVAATVAGALESMGQAGEMVEAVEFENADAKFSGFKLLGAKVSAEIAASGREPMEAMLGAETVTKLLAAVAKKNLVIASGTLGPYVVMFIGSSEKDCQLVGDLSKSLTTGKALAFADAYATKEMAGMLYVNESSTKAMSKIQGGISTYTSGLRDGLAGEDGLGDTRDLEALLQMVADREAALRKLGGMEACGTVAFFEQGLKIESYGGFDPGALDWKSPAKLAHLGDAPDVAFFANMTSDAAYDKKARAYYESLVETAYAITMKVAELPVKDEKMKQFKEMASMFNVKFRPDLVALWDAMKGDFTDGLGKEGAFVIDLKGTVPPIPGLPKPIVDKGRFPRLTMISPVTDRVKLASSWEKMNAACTKLLGKVSELSGKEIPMQRPVSSEKDGYKTWFMSFPFFNDDFLPSVTVGDKWFAASTSKNRALDLLAKADKGGPGRSGLWIKMDFKAMRECVAETMKLLDENAVAIFGEDSPKFKSFNDSKGLRDKLVDAMGELDSFTIHSRREGAVLRGSIHFKTR